MANRYWVGTGTWDGSNTANWSTTSGGAGGASVPTSSDNVIFNSSSGVCTVGSDIVGESVSFGGGYSSTFNTGVYNPSFGLFSFFGGTLNMGSGLWTIREVLQIDTGSTLNKETANIKFSGTLTNYGSFNTGGKAYNDVWFANNQGVYNMTISGTGCSINTLKSDPNQYIFFEGGSTFNISSIDAITTNGNEITFDNNDTSNIGTVDTFLITAAGSGYTVGDMIIIESTEVSGNYTFISVDTVNGSGGVTSASVIVQQSYFIVGQEYTDTGAGGPTGTGCKITPLTLYAINYAVISDTSGTNTVEHINIRGIQATGGATFIDVNGTDMHYNDGWSFVNLITQTLTDIVKTTPLLLKTTSAVKSETLRLTSSFIKYTTRIFSQSIRFIDILIKKPSRLLLDSIIVIESLIRGTGKVFSNGIVLTGTIIRSLQKTITDTTRFIGSIIKAPSILFGEYITITSTLIRNINKLLQEQIGFISSLIKTLSKTIANIVRYIDTKIITLSRVLYETIRFNGVFTSLGVIYRELAETLRVTSIFFKNTYRIFVEFLRITPTLIKILSRTLSESIRFITNLITLNTKYITGLESIKLPTVFIKTSYRIFTESIRTISFKIVSSGRVFSESIRLSNILTSVSVIYKEVVETLRLTSIMTSIYVIARVISESIRLGDIIDTVLYPFGFVRRKMVGVMSKMNIGGSSNRMSSYGSQNNTNIKSGSINRNNSNRGSMRKYR